MRGNSVHNEACCPRCRALPSAPPSRMTHCLTLQSPLVRSLEAMAYNNCIDEARPMSGQGKQIQEPIRWANIEKAL